MVEEGCAAKLPPRNVIMRNVGITARISPLLAAWYNLNFDILFMMAALQNLLNKKISRLLKNDLTYSEFFAI